MFWVRDAPGFELINEIGAYTGSDELSLNNAIVADPLALVLEDFLEGDDLTFHTGHFIEAYHAARSIAHAANLNDDVDGRGYLFPHCFRRYVEVGHGNHLFQPAQRVTASVGVNGRHRAVMSGIHCLQHVECLAAADLADDDPVGPHAQRVFDQIALRDFSFSFDVRDARFQPGHVEVGRIMVF